MTTTSTPTPSPLVTNDDPMIAALKQAMRGLAKGVVIISTAYQGQRYAMAATSVAPVSMEPPSMLCCVNRTASTHQALIHGADFCINILFADQEDVAKLCSGATKGEARFTEHDWQTDAHGIPYLANAQANVMCTQEQRVPYGSHDIVIGRVRAVHSADQLNPLIYFDGAYRQLAANPIS